MGMFIAYERVPAKDIRKYAKEAIKGVGKWFKANPKRDDCNMELWYGKRLTVTPKNYEEKINELAEETIEEDKRAKAKK